MLKHVFVAPFPRAKRSFCARGALIHFIVAVAALEFESRQREHSSSCCSSGVAKRSSKRAQQQLLQQRCCKKVIDNTHCCHRMTVRAAGGRRTGCGTRSRCGQQQQQQQQQYNSSQASIGAVVGCVRVFCGVVRDAVGFKMFFDRAIRSTHPVEKVYFLDGMCGTDCSIEKIGIEKALFQLLKNARFGLRSEIALFDPPIRLHKNWPKHGLQKKSGAWQP